MTTFLPTPTSVLDIPETPDLDRMRRETGARLRSAMLWSMSLKNEEFTAIDFRPSAPAKNS